MDNLHVIFPGSFKPFHEGHYLQIQKYLELSDYNVDIRIIISNADREGIKAETSKSFMDKVFSKEKRVSVEIAKNPSPIKAMYDIINNGKGTYTMVSSDKGDDKKRVEDLLSYYKKHPVDGVKVISTSIDYSPIVYSSRSDDFSEKPISSTIIRNDIRNKDFESFKLSYQQLLKDGVINETDLKKYFDKLSKEIIPLKDNSLFDNHLEESYFNNIAYKPLNEGGMGGHMSHPYEVDEFTFKDLKDMINDIFNAKVEDMTEKLDGQNLFASVNKKGQTVYARNMTDMTNGGMSLQDMSDKWAENETIANSFVAGGKIIDKVFHKIKDRTIFFNRFRGDADYKLWVNCEIVNPSTENVIPYGFSEPHVYFHGLKSYITRHFNESKYEELKGYNEVDNEGGYSNDMEQLTDAVKSVENSAITNKIVMKQLDSNYIVVNKLSAQLDDIAAIYDMSDNNTLKQWKSAAFKKEATKSLKDIIWIYDYPDIQKMIESRWICNTKSVKLSDIKKSAAEAMKVQNLNKQQATAMVNTINSTVEKEKVQPILKKILKPLDQYFINLGNEVIKRCKGFTNDGKELNVIYKLKEEIRKTIESVKNGSDKDLATKLNDQLNRLRLAGDKINATEGIVLKYRGKTIKLTGSFAAVNQILGMERYKR